MTVSSGLISILCLSMHASIFFRKKCMHLAKLKLYSFLCVICVCLSTFQNREVGWIHTNEGFDTTSQVRPLYLKTRAQPPKDHLPKCDGESSIKNLLSQITSNKRPVVPFGALEYLIVQIRCKDTNFF